MQIVNEEDLYLIGQYYNFGLAILNALYMLNQRSYDRFYKLKDQKIKQLVQADFVFKNFNKDIVKQSLKMLRDNISSEVIRSNFEWYCYKKILNLL